MFPMFKLQSLSWQDVDQRLAKTYGKIQLQANTVGICICFLYFAFFDGANSRLASWSDNLGLVIIMSFFLMTSGFLISHLWLRDVRKYVAEKIKDRPIASALSFLSPN